MTKITIENISHQFAIPGKTGLTAIQDINLNIEKGEMVALIGESGCGKTTLLSIIAGLVTASIGTVRVDGELVTKPHYSRGMMFQYPCLLPWLTVAENIAFGCNLRGEKKGLDEKVNHFIELIGLKGFENTFPSGLSDGMRQRTSLARALIGEPEILLLDECFSDIDVSTRERLLKLVLDLWQKLGLTIVLVTHDIEEALILSQRIVLLGSRPGRIQHIFNVNLPYPRNIDDPALISMKKEIVEKFNE